MSSLAKSMATKLIKLVIYGKVNTPMNHYVSPTTWSHDKVKTRNFFLRKTYYRQNGEDVDVWWGKTHYKVAWLPDRMITKGGHMANEEPKIENGSVVIKIYNNSLSKGATFWHFGPKFTSNFFQQQFIGVLLWRVGDLFPTKENVFSYDLFIFNNRNNNMPLKSLIKIRFSHILKIN